MSDNAKPYRLYLVEDSEIMVRLLRELLGCDPAVEIVGQSVSAGVAEAEITALVRAHVQQRQWGFLGEPRVNVLELNLALNELSKK